MTKSLRLLILSCLTVTGGLVWGGNLLTDGGFEGLAPSVDVIWMRGWTTNAFSPATQVFRSPADKHLGAAALVMKGGPNCFVTTRPVTIKKGTDYSCSLWTKPSGLAERGFVVELVLLNSGKYLPLITDGGTHEWKQLEATAKAESLPADTTQAMVRLHCRSAAGMIVLDDLVLKPAGDPTGNLLTNGSFEDPDFCTGTIPAGRDWQPLAWYSSAELISPEIRVETGLVHSGKQSLKICGRANRGAVISTRHNVTRGGRYKISGWIKTDGVREAELFHTRDVKQGESWKYLDERSVGVLKGTSDWTYIEKEFDNPNSDGVVIWLRLPLPTDGTAWFDDIVLDEIK